MKKLLLLFILVSGFAFGQNTFKYTSYKMDDSKKVYDIFINYDDAKNFKRILIGVDSFDEIYKKSRFIIPAESFPKFVAYLNYVLNKKIEYDIALKTEKKDDFHKKIDWDEGLVLVNCIYENGPAKYDIYLHTTYIANKGSSIFINTAGSGDVKSSGINFSDNKLFELLLSKLDYNKINTAITNDYNKKSALK